MLTLIVGAMKSNKTGLLNFSIERQLLAKKNIKVFYPAISTRDEDHCVMSRNGSKQKAIKIHKALDIMFHLNDDDSHIFIDEFQFFDSAIFPVIKNIHNAGKDITCSGLDLNFKGECWNNTLLLYPLADKIIKPTSICENCGSDKGRRTMLEINGKPSLGEGSDYTIIENSSKEVCYKTLCIKCYNEAHNIC